MVDEPSCSDDSGPSDAPENEEKARRELRHAYRNLINESLLQDDQDDAAGLTEALDRARQLFSKVTRTQEAVLDSRLMLAVAAKGRKCAATLPVGLLVFNAKEFAERALAVMDVAPGVRKLDRQAWAQLGKFAGGPLKTSAPLWYLHGAAGELPPKVRQPRVPSSVDTSETTDRAPTVPRKVITATSHETTTEDVSRIHELLTTLYGLLGRPLPYHELVIHPKSFSRTCENIFHLSFLVNSGHVRIALDENGLLCAEPVDHRGRSRSSEKPLENAFIMTLSMQQWKDAVGVLHLTEPAIPD
uniref:Non-structural maintenance of chromosomes element 4 n=1 Tax=Ixodes ricinus TaxID=34613 RepID=A0A6B0V6T4_IXORI